MVLPRATSRCVVQQFIGKPRTISITMGNLADVNWVPARVNDPQPIQVQPERQRFEPVDRLSPSIRLVGKFIEKGLVLMGILAISRPEVSTIAVGRVKGDRVEFVVSHDG